MKILRIFVSVWLLILACAAPRAADIKISALPETTTFSNSDVVPIVHGGATDKIKVGNLLTNLESLWVNVSGVIKPAAIGPTNVLLFTSGSADNATNVALVVGTVNAWTNGTMFQLQNAGSPLLVARVMNSGSFIGIGTTLIDPLTQVSSKDIFNIGVSAGSGMITSNSLTIFNIGDHAGTGMYGDDIESVFNWGSYAGSGMHGDEGVYNLFNYGDFAGGSMYVPWGNDLFNYGDNAGAGESADHNTYDVYNYGDYAGNNLVLYHTADVYNYGDTAGKGMVLTNSDDIFTFGYKSGLNSTFISSQNVYMFGWLCGTNLSGSYNNLYLFGTQAQPTQNNNQFVFSNDNFRFNTPSTISSGDIRTTSNNSTNIERLEFDGTLHAKDFVVTGSAFRPEDTSGAQFLVQIHDDDTAGSGGRKTFMTGQNGSIPTLTIAPPSGGAVNLQGVLKANDGSPGLSYSYTNLLTGLLTNLVVVKNGLIVSNIVISF